jgi:hypothetical protein
MSTGGVDDEDWIGNQLTWAQDEVLAGTGFRLGQEPKGIEIKVDADPVMEPAQEGSKNLWPDMDPYLGLVGSQDTMSGHNIDLDNTRVAYDSAAGNWEVAYQDPCEDDPDIPGNEDTAERLAATAATVTFLARADAVNGEDHFVEVETAEGACATFIDARTGETRPGRQYQERHIHINLPANTRGLKVSEITRLGDALPLEAVYPNLAVARAYANQYGGPDVAFRDTDFWRSSEAWQLLAEGYLDGVAFDPVDEYQNRSARLSQIDLLARIAEQHGWDLSLPSLVNSMGSTPRWVAGEEKYGFPEIDNVMRAAGRGAFDQLFNRWNGARFPGLTIAAVVNPASDDEENSRRRRNYYDYTWERFWSTGPTSHAVDIMRRVAAAHPGEVAFEQRGIMYPQNSNLLAHGNRIIGEVAAEVDPSRTTLVLPIFDYPTDTSNSAALLAQFRADLGARPDTYGNIYVPIYPAGSLQNRIALSTAAINARGQIPNLEVAIPGDWDENTTADIIGSSIFSNAMQQRMAAAQGRP